VLLLDVTPLSLGIETMGGVSTKLIERNTTIPASKSQTFSTAADNQPSVEINILQGEREMASDNKSLGRFILDGIPPAPRGLPQIEVEFDIDASGILNVSAKDKATGKEQKITITGSTGLDKAEVEKMTKEAELHAEEDTRKKEEIETRNTADSLVYTAERTLKDAEGKIEADLKSSVETKLQAVKDALSGTDTAAMTTATEALSAELQKVGTAMYQSGAATESTSTDTTERPEEVEQENKDGQTVEGEVVDEDQKE
jgi:molecular chaperone DnaK